MKIEIVGKLIGVAIRFGGGALAFGLWQHSLQAGIFAFFLLITIDQGNSEGK